MPFTHSIAELHVEAAGLPATRPRTVSGDCATREESAAEERAVTEADDRHSETTILMFSARLITPTDVMDVR